MRKVALIFLAAVLPLLAGCLDFRHVLTIQADGTARFVLTVTIAAELAREFGGVTPENCDGFVPVPAGVRPATVVATTVGVQVGTDFVCTITLTGPIADIATSAATGDDPGEAPNLAGTRVLVRLTDHGGGVHTLQITAIPEPDSGDRPVLTANQMAMLAIGEATLARLMAAGTYNFPADLDNDKATTALRDAIVVDLMAAGFSVEVATANAEDIMDLALYERSWVGRFYRWSIAAPAILATNGSVEGTTATSVMPVEDYLLPALGPAECRYAPFPEYVVIPAREPVDGCANIFYVHFDLTP